MKRLCKLLCLLLAGVLLLAACDRHAPQDADTTLSFTDSTGHTVAVGKKPQRVAVLFSSLADVWTSAGGSIAVTVGETVERGIVSAAVTLVDDGAGKTINTELLIAAAPDLVLVSADVPAQTEAAALLREVGIPVAELRMESFDDYLQVLKICTDLCDNATVYQTKGIEQQQRITAVTDAQPFAGKRILFVRAGSGARSVKAKSSTDHFAAAMIAELGAVNIADSAPLLLDSLSMEVILAEDPDYIFFISMGDEDASRSYVTAMLSENAWQGLQAVRSGKWSFLSKDLFHYKPCDRWAEAYEALAALPI